jgi:putative FmdB family regulatory protein
MRAVPVQTSVPGSEAMPTYDYRCDKCQKRFKRSESIAEHQAAKPSCPKCGSKKVSRVPGRFFAITGKKS